MSVSQTTRFSLKEPLGKTPVGVPSSGASPAVIDQEEDGAFLLCANCLNLVTFQQAAISLNGSHQHTFANPHGLVFTIGCFRQAPGCAGVGEATPEFSWFAGFYWRVAVCAACLFHLGWRFSSGESTFYGLILKNLVESNSAAGNA